MAATRRRFRSSGPVYGVLLASLWVGLPGCLIELERRIACGDGYVDREAGEECDPMDPDEAHVTLCAEIGMPLGRAGCDPETCTVITTPAQCNVCGDGMTLATVEDCDNDFQAMGLVCPDGSSRPQCNNQLCVADFSSCPTCRNGVNEADEECDPIDPCDGISPPANCGGSDDPPIAVPTDCSELEVKAAPIFKTQYTQGSVNQIDCSDKCEFDRQKCSFCGDGVLDPEHLDQGFGGGSFTRPAERCEVGLEKPTPLVQEKCNGWCRASSPDVPTLCNYRCLQGCLDVELDYDGPIESADPVGQLGCCSPKGTVCDAAMEFPCCRALAEPGMGDGCVDQLLSTGELQSVCG